MPAPVDQPSPLKQAAAFFSRIGERLRNRLRRHLGPNGDLLALSVLLAFVLIRLIRPIAVGERTFSVPVTVTSTSPSSTVVGVSPAAVTVTLRGPVKALDSFYGPGLSLHLSSSNPTRRRTETIPFGTRSFGGLNDGLRVIGLSTNEVRVDYDNLRGWTLTEQHLALPQIEGVPLQGIATVSIVPGQSFTISGSEKLTGEFVQKGVRLPLGPVSVKDKIDSFETSVPIRIPDGSGITSVHPSNALVRISIEIAAPVEAPVPVAIPVPPSEAPLLPALDEQETPAVEIVDEPMPPPATFPEDDDGEAREDAPPDGDDPPAASGAAGADHTQTPAEE